MSFLLLAWVQNLLSLKPQRITKMELALLVIFSFALATKTFNFS